MQWTARKHVKGVILAICGLMLFAATIPWCFAGGAAAVTARGAFVETYQADPLGFAADFASLLATDACSDTEKFVACRRFWVAAAAAGRADAGTVFDDGLTSPVGVRAAMLVVEGRAEYSLRRFEGAAERARGFRDAARGERGAPKGNEHGGG